MRSQILRLLLKQKEKPTRQKAEDLTALVVALRRPKLYKEQIFLFYTHDPKVGAVILFLFLRKGPRGVWTYDEQWGLWAHVARIRAQGAHYRL